MGREWDTLSFYLYVFDSDLHLITTKALLKEGWNLDSSHPRPSCFLMGSERKTGSNVWRRKCVKRIKGGGRGRGRERGWRDKGKGGFPHLCLLELLLADYAHVALDRISRSKPQDESAWAEVDRSPRQLKRHPEPSFLHCSFISGTRFY